MQEYSFLYNKWSKISASGECPSARSFHISLEIEGKMLIIGGLRKADIIYIIKNSNYIIYNYSKKFLFISDLQILI